VGHAPLGRVAGEKTHRGVVTFRAQSFDCPQVGVIHREDEIKIGEIAGCELARPQIRQVVAARMGCVLHRAVGRGADMPVTRAGAVGCDIGGERAKHNFGAGRPADIAEADEQDPGGHEISFQAP